MKHLTLSALVGLALASGTWADVQYSVIAFPSSSQGVGVSVDGNVTNLNQSSVHPNIYSGNAPSGTKYQYVITNGQSNTPESTTRALAQGSTSTGNEFFNRSQTIYNVPTLPQAYNPVYPTLLTNFNRSNEIATIIMSVNATGLDAFNKNPTGNLDDAQITNLAYISNQEVYTFQNAGLSTSGQSTKDFAKQSWAIEFDKFNAANATSKLLYGRSNLKLRAEETDASFAREKMVLDMLAAAGAATLSGSWVRVFINNDAYGLFLLMDDGSTHLLDNILHGGNWSYPYTGVTYKGNTLGGDVKADLVYKGSDPASYSSDIYKLDDVGEETSISKKNNSQALIIQFTQLLSQVNYKDATDDQHLGSIANLIDSPQNTLLHTAMSFLIGSWDGYWYGGSNFYLTQDIQSKKWTLITYDFDETYGGDTDIAGLNTLSYKNYTPAGDQRPLVDVFLNNTYYDGEFQNILKTLVKKFYKPSIVNPILTAWSQMLKEDIEWTRTIAGRSPGTKTSFTVQDFQNGLLGNNTNPTSISQWVSTRSAALLQQLNFNDTDDLPALPAYTSGTYLDSNGNVVNSNNHNNAGTSAANGGSTAGAKNAASFTKVSTVFTAMTIMVVATVVAL